MEGNALRELPPAKKARVSNDTVEFGTGPVDTSVVERIADTADIVRQSALPSLDATIASSQMTGRNDVS